LKWRAIVLVFTLLGLLFASQVWIDYAYARRPVSWPRALGVALAEWYIWAALTPLVLWLARRFPIDRRRWVRPLAVHLPASLLCTAVKIVLETMLAGFITGVSRAPFSFIKVHVGLITYWGIVGAAHWIERDRRYRQRELLAARLQAELARSQVQALRMQLHPHFLFNTLNSIAALMREDVEAADVMIARLSDLLRVALDTADLPEVPLRRELEFAEMYLGIQRTRIGDRLQARVQVEPGALDAAVPTLLLQPLLENAIRHGAGARPGQAVLELRARIEGPVLVIEVEDDGPGPPDVVKERLGLENTRARLAATYGTAARLELGRGHRGGALARVVLPAQSARAAEAHWESA
jgi:signal transduction histidine kinase